MLLNCTWAAELIDLGPSGAQLGRSIQRARVARCAFDRIYICHFIIVYSPLSSVVERATRTSAW
jgi:hypothetical protein